jgi:BirA family biotin operon repressor/biotin-[acetyl-CoA-carboxylase] ligase
MPAGDLATEAVVPLLPGREVRCYPAVLSTESVAQGWAAEGAPSGSVVVADFQASPRGRAGFEWRVTPGSDLGFSVVLHPALTEDREGWLYTIAMCALTDVIGGEASIEWPDQILVAGERAAVVGVHTNVQGGRVAWAVVTVLLPGVPPPRAPVLARALEALASRAQAPPSEVLDDYLARCSTLERGVRARLIPLGSRGVVIEGRAAACLQDGALVIVTREGRRMAVRPQALGVLEDSPHT